MENYFARLLLTSELDDPLYFAKVHQRIADLERKRVAHFNEHGPLNQQYITLMSELNMAYLDARDTTGELEAAQQIHQNCQLLYGDTDELTLEAFIALGSSYLDDGQSEKAQSIATNLLGRNWTEQKGPSYDLYIDALCLQADIFHSQQKFSEELKIRIQVVSLLESMEGAATNQAILARCALALCHESLKQFQSALDHYQIIRSYFDVEQDYATEAEKIGLLVHIGRCYRKLGNLEDSKIVYQWAHTQADRHFGPASLLAKKTGKIVGLSYRKS